MWKLTTADTGCVVREIDTAINEETFNWALFACLTNIPHPIALLLMPSDVPALPTMARSVREIRRDPDT